MPPFKRTSCEFTGETSVNGSSFDAFTGQQVTVLHLVHPATDEHDGIYQVEYAGQRFMAYGDDLFPHPDAPATNQEMMAHLMEWASTPLVHVFIFDAIEKQAARVLADEDATRAAMENGLVGGQAWINAAREARDAVQTHLAR